jgi:hypothetical protein
VDLITRFLAVTSATLAVIAFQARPETPPTQPPTPTTTTLLEAPRPLSVVPSNTLPPPPADAQCPQWWGLAREAGWTDDLLPTLDYVMWRESRCDPTQHNTTLNKDGSTDLGLTQVNDRSWCLATRWYPEGYLQTIGTLTTVGCEQLFDPYLNLLSAKAIYDYAEETNGNGWQPWRL